MPQEYWKASRLASGLSRGFQLLSRVVADAFGVTPAGPWALMARAYLLDHLEVSESITFW